MSAPEPRDIIAEIRIKPTSMLTAKLGRIGADAILEALTAAGYRVVRERELDAATVERCAQTVEGAPNVYSDPRTANAVHDMKTGIAAALRALVGEAK